MHTKQFFLPHSVIFFILYSFQILFFVFSMWLCIVMVFFPFFFSNIPLSLTLHCLVHSAAQTHLHCISSCRPLYAITHFSDYLNTISLFAHILHAIIFFIFNANIVRKLSMGKSVIEWCFPSITYIIWRKCGNFQDWPSLQTRIR